MFDDGLVYSVRGEMADGSAHLSGFVVGLGDFQGGVIGNAGWIVRNCRKWIGHVRKSTW